MLKGAWRWLTDIVWLKDFAVEVQVSVDAILGYILVLGISLVVLQLLLAGLLPVKHFALTVCANAGSH